MLMVPENSIATPWMVTGNSEGVEISKAKIFKEKHCEGRLEFPGNREAQRKNHP